MQSTAKDVTTYLEEIPAERKEALVELRRQCLANLKGFEESMQYGGPCYSRNGVVEVGFASQKHFIGLYILRTDVMKSHLELLKACVIMVVHTESETVIRIISSRKANQYEEKIYFNQIQD